MYVQAHHDVCSGSTMMVVLAGIRQGNVQALTMMAVLAGIRQGNVQALTMAVLTGIRQWLLA